MSFFEKFLATFVILFTAVAGSIGFFNLQQNDLVKASDNQSSVLGVTTIDTPQTDDVSINSSIPDIDPPSIVDVPDKSDIAPAALENSTVINLFETPQNNLPEETLETDSKTDSDPDPNSNSNFHDHDSDDAPHDNHEGISIIYTPESITQAPAKSTNSVKPFTPEEVFVANSFPTVAVGFTSSSVTHNAKNLPVNQSITLTLPDNFNARLVENLKFYPSVEFTKTLVGNQLIINPINQNRDTQYVFGLLNNPICFTEIQACQSDLSQRWSYGLGFTTAVWQDTIYGKSVQGRDLKGTVVGKCRTSGCVKIMLTGGLHGSEWRSGDLTQLIEYLKINPAEIAGQDKEFYIIPFTNPDGTALNQRYNSRNVNLNRNFPTSWVGCTQCGTGPNSEPETKALHDLTWNYRPKYLISYHAQWPPNGIIFRGNDNSDDTRNFAQWVANRTGYPIGEFPDFDTVPGDQTVWAESQGIQSLIIEATYLQNSDWNKNFNMYLALLREI